MMNISVLSGDVSVGTWNMTLNEMHRRPLSEEEVKYKDINSVEMLQSMGGALMVEIALKRQRKFKAKLHVDAFAYLIQRVGAVRNVPLEVNSAKDPSRTRWSFGGIHDGDQMIKVKPKSLKP